MTYSFPSLKPVHSFISGSICCFLACIQISQEAGQVVWCSHLFHNFPQSVVIHTVKGFGIKCLGFACGSVGKESNCNARDLGSIPGLGRSPGEGKGYSLQYPSLEKSMDCTVHGVTKSWTRQTFIFSGCWQFDLWFLCLF